MSKKIHVRGIYRGRSLDNPDTIPYPWFDYYIHIWPSLLWRATWSLHNKWASLLCPIGFPKWVRSSRGIFPILAHVGFILLALGFASPRSGLITFVLGLWFRLLTFSFALWASLVTYEGSPSYKFRRNPSWTTITISNFDNVLVKTC
jgi:hypothetical protein